MEKFVLIKYLLAGGSAAKRVHNLYRLATHSNCHIRRHVAENNSCPKELLTILAQDPNPDVRMAVALNANAGLDTCIFLSNDESPDVRHRIASTSYMPASVLWALTQDENPYVQARAKQTLRRLGMEIDKKVTSKRKAVQG